MKIMVIAMAVVMTIQSMENMTLRSAINQDYRMMIHRSYHCRILPPSHFVFLSFAHDRANVALLAITFRRPPCVG